MKKKTNTAAKKDNGLLRKQLAYWQNQINAACKVEDARHRELIDLIKDDVRILNLNLLKCITGIYDTDSDLSRLCSLELKVEQCLEILRKRSFLDVLLRRNP